MDTHPREGVVKEDKSFHTVGNPLTGVSVGSFEISEGSITWRKTNKQTNPQNMHRSTTTSEVREVGAGQGGTGCIIGP